MDKNRDDKIESAVRACLQSVQNTNTPFTQIGAFIDSLPPSWTPDETLELQRRIIAKMFPHHLFPRHLS